MDILNEISSALQQGKVPKVKEYVQQALDEGIPANEILVQGLLSGMDIIGEKFKNNEIKTAIAHDFLKLLDMLE